MDRFDGLRRERMICISVIYMASGFGKRFGRNKLLEEVQGKKLYLYGLERFVAWREEEMGRGKGVGTDEEWGVGTNEGWGVGMNEEWGVGGQEEREGQRQGMEVRIVLVSQYQEILAAGREMGLVCVENRQAEEGITASIRLGLAAAGEADFYLFSVADQPWLRGSTVKRFVWEFIGRSARYSIGCLSAGKGEGGNPVIFHRCYREELLALRGDKGGGQVMKRYPERVFYFLVGEEELKDIDRISDVGEWS